MGPNLLAIVRTAWYRGGPVLGLVYLAILFAINVFFIVSGSYALDAWFGFRSDWPSIAIMTGVSVLFPSIGIILAIIGLFYWF